IMRVKHAGTMIEKMSSLSPAMYSLIGKYMTSVMRMLNGSPIPMRILAWENTRGSSGCALIFRNRRCTGPLAAPAAAPVTWLDCVGPTIRCVTPLSHLCSVLFACLWHRRHYPAGYPLRQHVARPDQI